ncbi:MAG: TlpA disulfide reductase family protein [Gammaproteobacteria bacterium]|nr:TlpA disulfide reductase family protein [Gammaproteobacteria bacterium]
MKKLLVIAGWLGMTMCITAAEEAPHSPYTVTGEFVVADLEEVPSYMQSAIDSGQIEVEAPIDVSAVTVELIRQVSDDNGKMVDDVLASGSFKEGKVAFRGTIDSPTKVTISVAVGSKEPMQLDAVIAPSQDLRFKLIDQVTPGSYDQLVLLDEYRIYENSAHKYAISGDLSELEEDLSFAEVEIYGSAWDEETQSSKTFTAGPVNPTDGKFVIEGSSRDPMVVTLYVRAGYGLYESVQAIVEPGVEVDVSVDGSTLVASAPDGSHHNTVIESWATSEDYLALVSAHQDALDAYRQEMEAQRVEAESSQDESATPAIDDTSASAESAGLPESESVAAVEEIEEPTEATGTEIPSAQGCEHVDTSKFEALDLWSYEPSIDEDSPEHMKLRIEVSSYRTAALQKIAENLDSPLTALLAVELGAYASSQDRLTALDKLATSSLDADLIARRVVPSRDQIVMHMESETNDRSLVPGQKAPEFTLTSLDGAEVSLYKTIAENSHVLVDFWASWCGPCIASFPKLKRLHAAFNDDGFEVISIAIDETFEEWEEKSLSLELPWIDLGEVDGKEFQGTTPVAYGVGWIPKSYLIDNKGCILDKDIDGDKLQEFLITQHGDKEELHDEVDEEESETSTGDEIPEEV